MKRGVLFILTWAIIYMLSSLNGLNAQQPSPTIQIPPSILPQVQKYQTQKPSQVTPPQESKTRTPVQISTEPDEPKKTEIFGEEPKGNKQPYRKEKFQNLTLEQQQALWEELEKNDGVLTAKALRALMDKPEFRDFTAADIVKARELLLKANQILNRKRGIVETEELKKEEFKKDGSSENIGVAKPKKPFEAFPGEIVIQEKSTKRETLFGRMKKIGEYQDVAAGDLKPFGHDFFKSAAVEIIMQRNDIPVPPSYVMGPGDEVRIMLWGRVNEQYNLVVDSKGTITIPQIGPVAVAGMTFEEMSKNVIQQVEKIIGAGIDISAGGLKNIPVFVLGDVKRPGSYNVSSFATVTDALLVVGGPSDIGSMRNVQVKRKGRVVTTFDLYDLLLKGDKSKDIALQADDVVFVPVTGPLVGIAGNVKRPAIYELKGRGTLHAVIELAGGVLPTAYTQQIQVERVIKNERQVVIDINDKRLSYSKDFMVSDADLIKIFSIAGKEEDVIFVDGNVKRPGKYEYRSGMRVKDVITGTADLQDETHFEYALIQRTGRQNSKSEMISFSLNKLFLENDASQNLELKPRDTIYVFSKWFFKDKPIIMVDGGVRSGGEFELVENTRVSDAISFAGGLTRDASLDDVELNRTDRETKIKTLTLINLKKALEGDPEHNIMLKDLDRITVKQSEDSKQERIVAINGEVIYPGRYVIKKGEKLSSLLERTGGYSNEAYLKGAVFTRIRVKEMQKKALDEMVLRLEKDLFVESSAINEVSGQADLKKLEFEQRKQFINSLKKTEATGRMSIKLVHLRLLKGSAFDIELENGDTLTVPTKNSVINVTGAVLSQGSYVHLDDMDYKDYIDIAGGYTRYADKGNAFVLKADGTARKISGGLMNWSQSNSRWELAAFSDKQGKLDAGDTIIVPEKLERTAWLREFKDITQVLMQLAVMGATVNYMFK